MKLSFNPQNLSNTKDRFIWCTIEYILNIIDKIKSQNDHHELLFHMLNFNMNTLNKFVNISIDFDNINIFELQFIDLIKTVPIDNMDDEFLS